MVWLGLVALGVILFVCAFEDPGEAPKEQPLGGLLAIFGDIQFNFPEQFMVLIGLGFLSLNLAWVASMVAAVTSIFAIRSAQQRVFPGLILVLSAIYTACGAWFWIGNMLG